MDAPLHWGRGQATTTIGPETATVEGVESGGQYEKVVEHGELATFALPDLPRIEPIAGLVFVPCCDETNGEQFKVLVLASDDFGGGGYGPVDVEFTWTRKGVEYGPE